MPIVVLLFFILCAIAPAESLERLDEIVRRAPNLDAFLGDGKLVDEYYEALAAYYGGPARLPRGKFDELLSDLRDKKEKVPGLKQRLWETTGIGEAFSIDSKIKTYGRKLDKAAWALKQNALFSKDAATFEVAEVTARKVSAELAALEKKIEGEPRAKKEAARREFYTALRADPAAVKAAAALFHTALFSETVQDRLRSEDPDLILDTFAAMRERPAEFFREPPGALMSLVLERVPRLDQLLEDKTTFPEQTRVVRSGKEVPVGGAQAASYVFRPIPRRFHGIWKGIPLGECVATHPERWATAALAGTQFYHVERDGSYLGFVQHVPLQDSQGRIVGSTDFGAPVLRSRVMDENGAGAPLFSQWLEQISTRLPKDWRGIAVSKSHDINNAGVLGSVRGSPSYLLGEPLGRARKFSHVDPMAARIARVSPKAPYGYGGRMILDGTTPNAGELTLLQPGLDLDFAGAASRIMNGNDVLAKLRLVAYARDTRNPAHREALRSDPSYNAILSILNEESRLSLTSRDWNAQRIRRFAATALAAVTPVIAAYTYGHARTGLESLLGYTFAAVTSLYTLTPFLEHKLHFTFPIDWIASRIVLRGAYRKQGCDFVPLAPTAQRP